MRSIIAADDATGKGLAASAPAPRPSGRSNKRGGRKTVAAPPPLDSLALMDGEDGVVFASVSTYSLAHVIKCPSQDCQQLRNDKETAVEKALILSDLQLLIQHCMVPVVRHTNTERDVIKRTPWLERTQGRIQVNRRVPTAIHTPMSFRNNLSSHRGIYLIICPTWRRCYRPIPRGPWKSQQDQV